jgi:hypothetical protein
MDGSSTSSLQYLHTYLSFIRLERTIQRNLLLIESALDNDGKQGTIVNFLLLLNFYYF